MGSRLKISDAGGSGSEQLMNQLCMRLRVLSDNNGSRTYNSSRSNSKNSQNAK